MTALHPQYVVDENQTPKAVLLPVAEWEQVVEDLEELDDIRAFDQAKAGYKQENRERLENGVANEDRDDSQSD